MNRRGMADPHIDRTTVESSTSVRRLSGTWAGAVAIFEVRGPRAEEMLRTLGVTRVPERDQLSRVTLRTADAEALDDALLRRVSADRFELGIHGGAGVADALLQAFSALGARREDSSSERRGDWLSRLDHAASRLVAPSALLLLAAQRSGAWQRTLQSILDLAQRGNYEAAREELASLLRFSMDCAPLLHPRVVALVGAPNAGKSSFFNAVIGKAQNVVDAQAGSTLDPVMQRFALDHLTVDLWDTAGLDPRASGVTARAVAETMRLVQASDFVIWLSPRGATAPVIATTLRVDAEISTCADLGPSRRAGLPTVSALKNPEAARGLLKTLLTARWPLPAQFSTARACAIDSDCIEELRLLSASSDPSDLIRRVAKLVNALGTIEH